MDVASAKAAKSLTAMDKFRKLDSKGTADAAATETSVETTHQNAVSDLVIFRGSKDGATILSTTGVDGKLVLWDVAKAAAVAGFSLA